MGPIKVHLISIWTHKILDVLLTAVQDVVQRKEKERPEDRSLVRLGRPAGFGPATSRLQIGRSPN